MKKIKTTNILLIFFTLIGNLSIAQDSHLNVGIMTGINLKNEIGMLGLSIAKSHHEPRIVYGVTLMTNPENFKTSGMIFMGYNLSKRLTTGAGVSINDWKLAKKPHTKPFVMLMFKPTSYPINFFINQSLFNKDMSFTNVGVRFTLFKITSKNEEAN
jgi:hypothetical protein|tara:strand:+ start:114 stop:584 length:471 start_codon:yes stop_codon:yes gene_type:complete